MSSKDSYDDEKSPDSEPAFSRDAVTPRGGFMARPGLKSPPRHAVVVRVGDAPESEHIPIARSSVPPPPPASVDPGPPSATEQITLRAIPRGASDDRRGVSASTHPSGHDSDRSAAALESAPPPSDAPLVASVRASESGPPRSRRARSRWTIVAAAAAGLILGLTSVAMKLRAPHSASAAAPMLAASTQDEQLPLLAASAGVIAARPLAPSLVVASPSASVEQRAASPDRAVLPAAASNRPNGATSKRSIF